MIRITDCEQGSPRWEAHRLGRPTGSQLNRVVTVAKCVPSTQQFNYACRLVAEALGETLNNPGSKEMQLGLALEDNARAAYEFETGNEVTQVAFIHNALGTWGFSPDGLVGDDGGVEIKVPSLHTHIGYILGNELPSEYRAQVWAPMLMGFEWWDFFSYSRYDSVPHFRVRVKADDPEFVKWRAAMDEHLPTFTGWVNDVRKIVGLDRLEIPNDLSKYDASSPRLDSEGITMFEGRPVAYF